MDGCRALCGPQGTDGHMNALCRPAAMAGEVHLVPFRTQKLSPRAPMVLRRESVGEQDAAGQQRAFVPEREGGASALPSLCHTETLSHTRRACCTFLSALLSCFYIHLAIGAYLRLFLHAISYVLQETIVICSLIDIKVDAGHMDLLNGQLAESI